MSARARRVAVVAILAGLTALWFYLAAGDADAPAGPVTPATAGPPILHPLP